MSIFNTSSSILVSHLLCEKEIKEICERTSRDEDEDDFNIIELIKYHMKSKNYSSLAGRTYDLRLVCVNILYVQYINV